MSATGFVRVRNLDQYQHYRDRRPAWVKIHQDLLEDYDFGTLPDAAKFHALGLILLASRTDNVIPADPTWIARKLGANSKVDLEVLIASGWLEPSDGLPEPRAAWESRYISEETKLFVLERDGRSCCSCGSTERLEFDHVIPISRGGTGVAENLQLLCRSCNRKKRCTVVSASAEQDAPRAGARSPSGSPSALSLDFVLPPELDTPPFRSAWTARLKERGALSASKRPTAEQLEAQLAKLAKLAAARGVEHAVACVERATEAGHQGVVFPEDFNGGNGHHRPERPARHLPALAGLNPIDLERYKARCRRPE